MWSESGTKCLFAIARNRRQKVQSTGQRGPRPALTSKVAAAQQLEHHQALLLQLYLEPSLDFSSEVQAL